MRRTWGQESEAYTVPPGMTTTSRKGSTVECRISSAVPFGSMRMSQSSTVNMPSDAMT